MDDIYDECVWDPVTSEMITVMEYHPHFKEMVACVNYILGEGTLRPYPVRGRLLMIEAETYDIVAFYLLRQLFKLHFPMVVTFEYTNFKPGMIGHLVPSSGIRYIATKAFDDRALDPADYYPPNEKNLNFRYQLCLIVFFCKLVGCPLSLREIRVFNGLPFFWRANHIGMHNARTVTEEEFSYLFGISTADARRVYVDNSGSEINASTLTQSQTGIFTTVQVEPAVVFGEPGVRREKKEYADLKSPMFDLVIQFFRDCGFDPDLVRASLYLKDNPMRSSTGNRAKFKLSSTHRKIMGVIEENFSLLHGPYPFKVFRSR